jgi:HSP20 family molecular chaperone IbpA
MVVDRNGLCLVLALPGVASDHLEVTLEEGAVVVRGERSFGAGLPVGEIIRLEIPYGRFERRVTLPYGNYRLAEVQLENGCLRLNIEQLL